MKYSELVIEVVTLIVNGKMTLEEFKNNETYDNEFKQKVIGALTKLSYK